MFISKFNTYLVVNNNRNVYSQKVCKGDALGETMTANTIYVAPVNTYEIYTKCPETGESGWDIKHVESTDLLIKFYPHFDCIISKNDCQASDGQFLDFLDYLASPDN